MEKWHESQTIAFWLIVCGTLVFLLVFSVIRLSYLSFGGIVRAELKATEQQLEHQQKLLETSILSQEEERTRIAGDLHDALIGKLISLQLKNQLSRDLSETDRLLQESIAEARRISHNLSPPFIEHTALDELLATAMESWKTCLTISFYRDVRTNEELSPTVKIHLTRIVQELITNAFRHGSADCFSMHLRVTRKQIVFRASDNGRGFDAAQLTKGLGMSSIALRVKHLGGTYRILSQPGNGATACVVLPFLKTND